MKKSSFHILCLFGYGLITLRMKISALIAFFGILSLSASDLYSQNTKFNLKNNRTTIRNLITFIEESSDFIFIYPDDIAGLDKEIRIHGKELTLDKILDYILKDTDITYEIIERQIILTQKPLSPPSIPVISLPVSSQTGTGSIRGKITDEKGFPMIGATIIVDQTTTGTIADANGNYQLLAVPAGKRTIKYSFVGYNTESREIELERGDVIIIDIKMTMSQVEILEVVAYGQARGQIAAINQQLNASGITNVLSAERLQELPDVNVAEAIGRLPGLMVERNRGEGQKIIIRGLEPKYNSVSIGGNMVPATALDDRSTDLNMISPDILGGVEVQKANTADKDADGLGGTVNLIIREAPSGFKMNTSILSGYSGHSKSISNYRANFYASNRFFNDKLGIMVTGNGDIAERNSDRFRVDYYVQGIPVAEEDYVKPWITNANLEVNIENRSRAGGSLLIDWNPNSSTTIKSNNFIGYLDRHIYDRVKQLQLLENYINLYHYHDNITQILHSHSIEGKNILFGSVLDWGGSYSNSINNKPYGHRIQFRKLSAFNGYSLGQSFDVEPPELIGNPEYINDFVDQFYLYNGAFLTYKAREAESGLFLNWKTPFRIGNFISGYVKVGAKYREKNRERLNVRNNNRFDGPGGVNDFMKVYPDFILTTEGHIGKISILNFLDTQYEAGDFLNNQYEYLKVTEVLDRDLISRMYDEYFKDFYPFIPAGAKDDYNTDESVLAYYAMSEIKLGKYLTFIPGIRYEKTDIEYRAYIADELPASEAIPLDVQFRDTTATNSYENFLPQIHLKIKPTDWFDIRLAYTNTLSRPDYNQLAPKKLINLQDRYIKLGNTKLNPSLSKNYDVILTFYKQKLGLLTLGAFYKEIDGFLWNRSALVIAGTRTDPEVLGLTRSTLGFEVRYPLNNENLSTIKGFEFDLQANLYFLPVKGFVLNMNLTLMESQTGYSETLIIRKANPDFGIVPGAPRAIFVNQDTAYIDRLLKQPSYLANIGLGYDNKDIGLSVRLSFNYQDDILISEQRRPDGADREGTLEFYRWDFQVNQRITKKLSFNGNIANIFNQPDRSVRLITGYLRDLEYYGSLAQFGLKYTFF